MGRNASRLSPRTVKMSLSLGYKGFITPNYFNSEPSSAIAPPLSRTPTMKTRLKGGLGVTRSAATRVYINEAVRRSSVRIRQSSHSSQVAGG
jgi:hypothetical protein